MAADMSDGTAVRAHHCAIGIQVLSEPRHLADREATIPPGSTQGALPESFRLPTSDVQKSLNRRVALPERMFTAIRDDDG